MSRHAFLSTLGAGACLLVGIPAHAHLTLTSPPPRLAGMSGGNQLKVGPCGQSNNARTETVTEFMPGETITVEWDEYINHPSYYRIAFDTDGDDDFPIRADMDDVIPESDDPAAAEPLSDVILAYVEEDPDLPQYSVDVTLPNVLCESCTLQVIQFMYDKVGNGLDDEYYFQCADIALRGEVMGTGGGDGAGGGSTGGVGGTLGGGGSGGLASDTGGGFAAGGSSSGGGARGAGGAPPATRGGAAPRGFLPGAGRRGGGAPGRGGRRRPREARPRPGARPGRPAERATTEQEPRRQR